MSINSDSDDVYLKPNLAVEPLVHRWYAQLEILAPQVAAMFIKNSHVEVMRSFISEPELHELGLKSPEMMGSSLINYPESRVAEIRALLSDTISKRSYMIEFARSVTALDELLRENANGQSMASIYEKVPQPLKGYIELVYDLNCHPSIRFIEGALYNSVYYDESFQEIALFLLSGDNRAFIGSTPRLNEPYSMYINIPFKSWELDKLFQMREEPLLYGEVCELFGVVKEDSELFSTFFTPELPVVKSGPPAGSVRVRYFGHACILIESDQLNILIDPLISYSFADGLSRYSFQDLPERIDYVLITHGHADHFVLETLLQIRYKVSTVVVPKSSGGYLADPSLKLLLKGIGFKSVIEMDEMESVLIPDGCIIGLPFLGEHSDLNIRSKLAYFISINEKRIFIGADSNNIEPEVYTNIRKSLGESIDLFFIGMECVGSPLSWGYGSLLTQAIPRSVDQSRRDEGSDSEKARIMVEILKPSKAFVYAMGMEPWLSHITAIPYTENSKPIIESNKFIQWCLSKGIWAERLYGRQEILLR